MPNIKSAINRHKTVLNPPTSNSERMCNCINKAKCRLQEKCLASNILYKVTITSSKCSCQHKIYYGITEKRFTKRFVLS